MKFVDFQKNMELDNIVKDILPEISKRKLP